MSQSVFSASLRLCAILIATASTANADWPFARGGTQSQGVASFSIGDEPELLWTYEPEGEVSDEVAFEGAPVIAEGTIYLADADGGLHAVSLASGEAEWTATLPDTIVLAAPAVADGRWFVGDSDGVLRAISTEDGSVLWTVKCGGEVYAGPIVYTPEGGEPLLLVTTELGRLYAFDPATGEERWRFEIADPLRCAPTVVNGHALLAGCDGRLHAIDLSTGEQAGSCDIGGPTGCTAAVLDDVACFGTESGEFYAVNAQDPATPSVAWTYRDPRRGQGIRAAAAVSESAVVYGNLGKGLYALNPADGELLWKKSLRSRLESSPLILSASDGASPDRASPDRASPDGASTDGASPERGERVLVATGRGRIYLYDLATGDETWSYDAGGGFIADPAASAGRVVLASTDGVVYCFGREPQMNTDERR
ncbi:MAG: PQQ-binding-like beta-propeller repeat protein [Planctomycetota bacterium]